MQVQVSMAGQVSIGWRRTRHVPQPILPMELVGGRVGGVGVRVWVGARSVASTSAQAHKGGIHGYSHQRLVSPQIEGQVGGAAQG